MSNSSFSHIQIVPQRPNENSSHDKTTTEPIFRVVPSLQQEASSSLASVTLTSSSGKPVDSLATMDPLGTSFAARARAAELKAARNRQTGADQQQQENEPPQHGSASSGSFTKLKPSARNKGKTWRPLSLADLKADPGETLSIIHERADSSSSSSSIPPLSSQSVSPSHSDAIKVRVAPHPLRQQISFNSPIKLPPVLNPSSSLANGEKTFETPDKCATAYPSSSSSFNQGEYGLIAEGPQVQVARTIDYIKVSNILDGASSSLHQSTPEDPFYLDYKNPSTSASCVGYGRISINHFSPEGLHTTFSDHTSSPAPLVPPGFENMPQSHGQLPELGLYGTRPTNRIASQGRILSHSNQGSDLSGSPYSDRDAEIDEIEEEERNFPRPPLKDRTAEKLRRADEWFRSSGQRVNNEMMQYLNSIADKEYKKNAFIATLARRRSAASGELRTSTSSPSQQNDGSQPQDSPHSHIRRESFPTHTRTFSAIAKESNTADMTNRLLAPLLGNLQAYLMGRPEDQRANFGAFARVPEWCVDKSEAGKTSFFGEDWGVPPKRVGRDPRYRGMGVGIGPGSGGPRSSQPSNWNWG
ncbi:MAG: hypothetical protein M1834_003367 [Cirrosporium novae-zelandiae]|nr:MAG: hypothetical protein M1834_003367 [Cirrosporium novae-zelandiae]